MILWAVSPMTTTETVSKMPLIDVWINVKTSTALRTTTDAPMRITTATACRMPPTKHPTKRKTQMDSRMAMAFPTRTTMATDFSMAMINVQTKPAQPCTSDALKEIPTGTERSTLPTSVRTSLRTGPDGFEDDDGCPDNDNDGDTIPDADDRCPLIVGPPENRGCPDEDSDGDGIVDRSDNCPKELGRFSRHGCKAPQVASIGVEGIVLARPLLFPPGKSRLEPESKTLLRNVALILNNHPEFAKVHLEVGASTADSDADNLTLADARAQVIQQFLVSQGVAATRIDAKGVGGAKGGPEPVKFRLH